MSGLEIHNTTGKGETETGKKAEDLERAVVETAIRRLAFKGRLEQAQHLFDITHDAFASAVYELSEYRKSQADSLQQGEGE